MDRDRYKIGPLTQRRKVDVKQGDPNAYGVQPQPGNIPTGPAPPYVRQVVSSYDSRPIGGYDFVFSGTLSTTEGAIDAQPYYERITPRGYVSVVRRIEVEANTALNLGNPQEWIFSQGGVIAVNWNYMASDYLSEFGVDTFFVVPQNTPIRLTAVTGFDGFPAQVGAVYVRFIGNLILDTNEPSNGIIGSLPHTVRVATKE